MSEWTRVAVKDDVIENMPLSITVKGKPIGLFRVGEEVFALNDICSHDHALLSTGFQDGYHIECPLHQAVFDVRTGNHLSPPAECGVQAFPVRIEGDDILVDVSKIPGVGH